jgi:hypothetical protein
LCREKEIVSKKTQWISKPNYKKILRKVEKVSQAQAIAGRKAGRYGSWGVKIIAVVTGVTGSLYTQRHFPSVIHCHEF